MRKKRKIDIVYTSYLMITACSFLKFDENRNHIHKEKETKTAAHAFMKMKRQDSSHYSHKPKHIKIYACILHTHGTRLPNF